MQRRDFLCETKLSSLADAKGGTDDFLVDCGRLLYWKKVAMIWPMDAGHTDGQRRKGGVA
jgi:hypothetical protein